MYKKSLAFASLFFILCNAYSQSGYRVKTIAGDSSGYRNGGNSVALFSSPTGIATDNAGNIYIADTYNNAVRVIWSDINLTGTLAGNTTAGFKDGNSGTAEFNNPTGICVDKNGNVYVADMLNNRIRKITPAGIVSTFAGNGLKGHVDTNVANAEFNLPTGIAMDTIGNLYVADNGNYQVRKIDTNGKVTTVAGSGYAGFYNGIANTAMFDGLFGIAVNDSGTAIYVSEYLNNDIRVIRNGMVSVFAGNDSIPTPPGHRDGKNDTALFNGPMGITLDKSGNLYVSDEYNNDVRVIISGMVYTFAGTDSTGFRDSTSFESEFNQPYGIVSYGNSFYVADNSNNRIREIAPIPLGIPSLTSTDLSLSTYPNPCNDKLIIASSPVGAAAMFDVMGKQVWSNAHLKAPCVISTTSFSPGLYFLVVNTGYGIATKKIVIER